MGAGGGRYDDRGGAPLRRHMYVYLTELPPATMRCICLRFSWCPLPTGDLSVLMVWNIYINTQSEILTHLIQQWSMSLSFFSHFIEFLSSFFQSFHFSYIIICLIVCFHHLFIIYLIFCFYFSFMSIFSLYSVISPYIFSSYVISFSLMSV